VHHDDEVLRWERPVAATADDCKALVLEMIENGMIRGDVEAALSAYAPDVVYHNPMLKALPPSMSARDVLGQFTRVTRQAFPDLRFDIQQVVAEDDRVAVLYSWSGTHRGPLGPLQPTGRSVTATGAIFCRVADGRIVEEWDIDDRLDVMEQLGVAAPTR
jgi:steroid delta-isomerase-like uncharacterized protein